MLETTPTKEQIASLLGNSANAAIIELMGFIQQNYGFEPIWREAGKYGVWEVKYRKSSKTLCALYLKDGYFTVLVIFGKAEREKFESSQSEFSSAIVELYSSTQQYHDGKWLWIDVPDITLVEDIKKLIMIKKRIKL